MKNTQKSQNLRGKPPIEKTAESQSGLPREQSSLAMTDFNGLPRSLALARNDDSFLDSAPSTQGANFAFGFNIIATNNFIFDGFNMESFDEKEGDKALAQAYFKHLQRARALSWWILQKGWVIE